MDGQRVIPVLIVDLGERTTLPRILNHSLTKVTHRPVEHDDAWHPVCAFQCEQRDLYLQRVVDGRGRDVECKLVDPKAKPWDDGV